MTSRPPKMGATVADLDTVATEWSNLDTLRAASQELADLIDRLVQAQRLAGSRALAAAIACYEACQAAARNGDPEAARIVEELSAAYEHMMREQQAMPPLEP